MNEDLNNLEPQNQEAEIRVLSQVLASPEIISQINLNPEDFYNLNNKEIFSAMRDILNSGREPHLLAVQQGLIERGSLEKIGGIEYLISLTDNYFPFNLQDSCNIIKEMAIKREAINLSYKIQEAGNKGESWREELSEMVEKFNKVLAISNENFSYATILDTFKNIPEEFQEQIGLTTGYIDLDRKIGGFLPTQVIIIAGRPGMGKTAFALNSMLRAAKTLQEDEYIVFYSLEQSIEQIHYRMICMELNSHKTVLDLKRGNFNSIERRAAENNIKDLDKLNIIYLQENDNSICCFKQKIRQIASKKKIKAVYLDHVGQMTYPGLDGEREAFKIAGELQVFGKEINTVMVILSQLNRQVEQRTNKRPILSDLRQTGNLEQVADLVFGLYRDEYYHPTSTDYQNMIEVVILKNRDGQQGKVDLHFNKTNLRVENSAGDY